MIVSYAHKRNVEAGAFVAGLRKLGYTVKEYNASDYGRGQVIDCEAVIVAGTRGKGQLIVDDHEAKGIKSIVIDYGYLDRVSGVDTWQTGHWQVGIGGLNRPPSFSCPADRFKRLSIQPKEPRTGELTLVLGQHSGDPSHGYTDQAMKDWAQRICDKTGGYFRPHPDSPHIEINAPIAKGDYSTWLKRAGLVYTICSTGGLEALIDGVPAIAEKPDRACWGALSGKTHPSRARVEELCHRLAYGQWTLSEMASGQAPQFIMQNKDNWHG